MRKPLIGENLAVLVANGFHESDLTMTQKALQPLGANIRIVSMDHGLVNSWNEQGWGLHFAADKALNAALAADFSMLVIPGGSRSIEKLKLTAHTRRFISGFIDMRKPVAFFGDAVELLGFSERLSGRSVVSSESFKEQALAAGANISQDVYQIDESIITGGYDAATLPEYVQAVSSFFVSSFSMKEAA
jgi:protease I